MKTYSRFFTGSKVLTPKETCQENAQNGYIKKTWMESNDDFDKVLVEVYPFLWTPN
jgi:hypothetical protein